jgi:hypothetical protein
MRRYCADDEERLRASALVREWTRSGLLEPAQQVALERDLQVDVKRTNPFLRAVLALFTTLIVVAAVALTVVLLGLDPDDRVSMAVITGLAALGCLGLEEYLVANFRLYRFGVEEALGVSTVGLAMITGAALTSLQLGSRRLPEITAMVLGAAGGTGLYARFGYLYAALGAIACVAAVPFQLDVSRSVQHLLAAAAMAVILTAVRIKRVEHRDDHLGGSYGWLQAAAVAGIYAVLNQQLLWTWSSSTGLFYWGTYLAIWLLPCAALAVALRDKDRELLDASLALGLLTLITNKPYLGWPRQTWDPILLGAALIATAVFVRRWLASGPGGERRGFTASRLLDADRAKLSLVGTASTLIPSPGAGRPSSQPSDPAFRGGRSGGAGAEGQF